MLVSIVKGWKTTEEPSIRIVCFILTWYEGTQGYKHSKGRNQSSVDVRTRFVIDKPDMHRWIWHLQSHFPHTHPYALSSRAPSWVSR